MAIAAALDTRAKDIVDELLREVGSRPQAEILMAGIGQLTVLPRIYDAPPELQCAIALRMFEWLPGSPNDGPDIPAARFAQGQAVREIAGQLFRRKLPFEDDELAVLVERMAEARGFATWLPAAPVLGMIERQLGKRAATGRLATALRALHSAVDMHRPGGEYAFVRDWRTRIETILAGGGKPPLRLEGRWGRAAQAEAADSAPLQALLALCGTADGSKPSKAWLAKARAALDAIPEAQRVPRIAAWLARAPGEQVTPPSGFQPPQIDESDATVQRGLVWAASVLNDETLATATGELAERCFRKVPNVGAVSSKVGNACVWALGQLDGAAAVAQLTRLDARVKYAVGKRLIAAALGEAAKRAGVTREDLEETAVPDFGLAAGGVLRREIGGWIAETRFEPDGTSTPIAWKKSADAKSQKSAPAELKTAHAAELAELKRATKELARLLPAHRDRIDRLASFRRRWRFAGWRSRWLENPVLGLIGRRLVWSVDGTLCSWDGARLADLDGAPVGGGSEVRLWHPISTDDATAEAWRARLAKLGVVQPFKQAHREIHRLSDDERATSIYSNRFAGHILKQHVLAALCRDRGWSYRLQGGFDGANDPILELPDEKLRVQLETEAIAEPDRMSPYGIYLYVKTDQVRFHRGYGDVWTASVPLAELDPIAFSEAMRDVDLFVGVAGIAADPSWRDRGAGDRWYGYWLETVTGAIGAAGIMRRLVIGSILPQLAFRDRLVIDERWLVVTARDGRRWRIHFGSGQVQDPDGTIVNVEPARGAPALPFAGDGVLSQILGKAVAIATAR